MRRWGWGQRKLQQANEKRGRILIEVEKLIGRYKLNIQSFNIHTLKLEIKTG